LNFIFRNEYFEPIERTFSGPKRRLSKVQKNGRFVEPMCWRNPGTIVQRSWQSNVAGRCWLNVEKYRQTERI
jgi:hypothetical protein